LLGKHRRSDFERSSESAEKAPLRQLPIYPCFSFTFSFTFILQESPPQQPQQQPSFIECSLAASFKEHESPVQQHEAIARQQSVSFFWSV